MRCEAMLKREDSMTSLAMPRLKAEQVELEQVASISILVTWEILSEISLAVCSEAAEADETAMDQEEVLM